MAFGKVQGKIQNENESTLIPFNYISIQRKQILSSKNLPVLFDQIKLMSFFISQKNFRSHNIFSALLLTQHSVRVFERYEIVLKIDLNYINKLYLDQIIILEPRWSERIIFNSVCADVI